MIRRHAAIATVFALAIVLAACGDDNGGGPAATATPVPTATATLAPPATVTPTAADTPTAVDTPTATAVPTSTPRRRRRWPRIPHRSA